MRSSLLVIAVMLTAAAAIVMAETTPVTVRIDSGLITGLVDTTRNARYFKGIPFAATTGGANRWLPPQPVVPWGDQALNVSDFGPGCLQTHHNPDVPTVQSEDCLNLKYVKRRVSADFCVVLILVWCSW